MKQKSLISFVVPIYNEEQSIPHLIPALTEFSKNNHTYLFEIILVENGSNDSSFKLLEKYAKKHKSIKIVQLTKNIGCDGGIEAGMHYASGEAVIIMMGDMQEPLSVVNQFISSWEKGYLIVYGIVQKRTAGFMTNLTSRIFYKILNVLTSNRFPENASDFRLLDKKVYGAINNLKEKNKYVRGLVMWTGFKSLGIPFDREERVAGKSKANFATAFIVALNGIFSFSYVPLRLVSLLGIAITFISFCMMVFYLYLFLVHGREAPGAMTIIMLILLLFGLLFFSLGIISEYMARIYEEVKERPSFMVKKTINTK